MRADAHRACVNVHEYMCVRVVRGLRGESMWMGVKETDEMKV